MFGASSVERFAVIEDRRMWRLLLARLHPDAGGDHDLFTFACTLRDELSGGNRAVTDTGEADSTQRKEDSSASFLQTWQDAMEHWSSCNREALKTSEHRVC